jgi:hypothetical protein
MCVFVGMFLISTLRVVLLKFLISVLSVRINWQKLMPCKYFAMFLFALKLLLLIVYAFQPATIVINKIPALETLQNINRDTKSSLKRSLGRTVCTVQATQTGPS